MTASEKKNIRYHEWVGYKLKGSVNSKAIKFLENLYPNKKEEVALRQPQVILNEMKALDKESAEILSSILELI